MSAVLLVAGATTLSGAVFVAVLSLQSLVAERRQAYRTIRALRAVEIRPVDVRDRELASPTRQRVLVPFYRAALAIARRFTPQGAYENLGRRLLMAGAPVGWDVDRVLTAKVGGLVLGVLIGALLLVGLPLPLGLLLLAFLALCALGYFAPNIVLLNLVQRRQTKIRLALPDAIDLLTISVEAGLGFDAALAQVSRNSTGPLAEEFYRTLQEVQLGRSRSEAMRNLADRSSVPERLGHPARTRRGRRGDRRPTRPPPCRGRAAPHQVRRSCGGAPRTARQREGPARRPGPAGDAPPVRHARALGGPHRPSPSHPPPGPPLGPLLTPQASRATFQPCRAPRRPPSHPAPRGPALAATRRPAQ